MDTKYSNIPLAGKLSCQPFKVSIPSESLDSIKKLLQLSRLLSETFENLHADRRYGVPLSWIRNAKVEWESNFDW
jgi:hypothetical protein